MVGSDFIVGGYPLVRQIALDGFGLKVTGAVVEVAGGDQVKTSIIQFTTADGEQVTFKSYGNKNIRFAIGEEVQVHYLAVNPRIAEIDMLGHINYPSNLGATCIGSFLLMGGLVFLRNKPLVLEF